MKAEKPAQGKIRQPIITLAGHVDHGKTSLLDKIRGTAVAKKEAGGITQAISCTCLPTETIRKLTSELLKQFKIKVVVPGFLFIDTPGHAAFTNLRKRGGSLADIAVLVIDIRDGIMEQTAESIDILKKAKVPFVVALNKLDTLGGWQFEQDRGLSESIKNQSDYVRKEFDKLLYSVVSRLADFSFDSDLFEKISKFTKQIPIVPCSAKTGEGIPELLVMVAGLAQKFLHDKLILKEKQAFGTVLETKREKAITFVESVVYEGKLAQGESIVIGSLGEPIITKVRALFEAQPLGKGFKPAKSVTAAAYVRLQVPSKQEILPGMPLVSFQENEEQAKQAVQREVKSAIKLDREGLVIKADSLGSLEALLFQLKNSGVRVKKAGIGPIKKSDIIAAEANIEKNPLEAAVLGFNVQSEAEEKKHVKVLTDNIIYKLLENFEEWKDTREREILREKLAIIVCKLKVLPYVFRKSKPAIFGVEIGAGKLKTGITLMNKHGKKIDKVKEIQSEGKNVSQVEKGKQIAISLPKITMGRQVKKDDILYSSITSEQYKELEENKKYLASDETQTLKEILKIKRKKETLWGV